MTEAVLRSIAPIGREILVGGCVWKIDNFGKGDVLRSPVFSPGPQDKIKLQLLLTKVRVSGELWYTINCLGFYNVQMKLPTVSMRHKFFLLDTEGKEIYSWIKQEKQTTIWTEPTIMHIAMIADDLKTGNPPRPVLRDKFTIAYEISLHELDSNSEILTGTMSKDFGVLFESQKESDVKFLVGSQEFTAHKMVVSTRSPVLATMFDTGMREKHENQVKIQDIDAETFKELLRFMYTDEVENIKEHAYELFKIAHRYELPALQRMCEDQLCKNLDVENCTVIFSTADTYECKYLKQRALEFMTNNAGAVRKTKGCELLATSYPHLILEAYHALAAKTENE